MQDYKRLFLTLALAASLLTLAAPAQIRVCSEGCDYSSIQQALDSAGEGQKIAVETGRYPEDLIIWQNVTLTGRDTGGSPPVISGSTTIASQNASLQGFAFDGQMGLAKAAGNCRLNVAAPALIYLNQFGTSGTVCPESIGRWNSSQPLVYQFQSQVLKSRLGNYWADYRGRDENCDGIGDSPHIIGPSAVDYYPLMQPVHSYRLQGSMEGKMDRIEARVDQPFEIRLQSNPTTGYQWFADYDYLLLSLESQDFERGESDALGASGTAILVFRPLFPGKTKVSLVYRRPWENIVADTRTYLIDIQGPEPR